MTTERIEDHSLADEPMVSYTHFANPTGPVFVQYAKDPLPVWAVNVLEIQEKKDDPAKRT